MGRAELVQVSHAIECIELIGDPGDTVTVDPEGSDGTTNSGYVLTLTVGAGEVSEIYTDGAGDMPAGTYQITATTAATPVDVRIVYRD
jgi:hypothetical protein